MAELTRTILASPSLLAVHRALTDLARRRIAEGADLRAAARELDAQAASALALLERGLADLAVRPG